MTILEEDTSFIYGQLEAAGTDPKLFAGSRILITGCAGFLGRMLSLFFADELRRRNASPERIVLADSFLLGNPDWLKRLVDNRADVSLVEMDIAKPDAMREPIGSFDYILHLASIASPTYYRKYPFETVDANVSGLRRIIDMCDPARLKGLLFFSSSEIYGDPDSSAIPTPESYPGRVECRGPRACYDEAKRFGETLCYLASTVRGIPVATVRPFNNYGPGMRPDDKRVPADFAQAVLSGRDLVIFSDGTPSRTFCYVADAVAGYVLALVRGVGDVFNIGSDGPETSIVGLADEYAAVAREKFAYQGKVRFAQSGDRDYLVHNPQRRCPDLTKARTLLGYAPKTGLRVGIERYLRHLIEERALEP